MNKEQNKYTKSLTLMTSNIYFPSWFVSLTNRLIGILNILRIHLETFVRFQIVIRDLKVLKLKKELNEK